MEGRRAIGLFQRSPRPKWRELTGAMRSLTVARDFQKFTKKNVGNRNKADRTTTNSNARSSSKSSSWMTSDEDDDDDDFAELTDFEIDEDECEKSRFSDAFISVSTDIFPDKELKDWDEDSVPPLNFDSAIKSTPIEKQESEENLSGLWKFKNGVLASSTPKTNKSKRLNAINESDFKFSLDLEGNILPRYPEKPALDLKADLFDDSHKDVEISMSVEKDLFNSNSPNILSRQHQTICSTSENKSEELNKGSEHIVQSIPSSSSEKRKFGLVPYPLNDTTIEDIEIEESIMYDEKGDPCNISNSLNNTSHLDETVCSKTIVPGPCEEPTRHNILLVDDNINRIKSEEKDKKSISSINSGKLEEAPATADSPKSFNKTSVSVDEKRKNMQNISLCMLSKLPKLGRRLAFRRKKETDLPKKVML